MARLYQELDLTKTQLTVFFVILLLAVDELNPVLIVLHVFPTVQRWHVAAAAVLLMAYVFLTHFKQLVYYTIKTFFHSVRTYVNDLLSYIVYI